jgi:hypothetical protein
LFIQFLAQRITVERPFYFHSDDSKLNEVFARVAARLGRRVTILPDQPPPQAEQAVWVDELTQSYASQTQPNISARFSLVCRYAQGCGHLRLMIESPSSYGLASSSIVQWLIRAFYEEQRRQASQAGLHHQARRKRRQSCRHRQQ